MENISKTLVYNTMHDKNVADLFCSVLILIKISNQCLMVYSLQGTLWLSLGEFYSNPHQTLSINLPIKK